MSRLLSLPFDQYQRHEVIREAVEAIREGRGALTVLDVGGAPGLLREFLPRDRVLVADREGGPGTVNLLASGLELPFPDRTFDLVVSSDTLEHLPRGRRGAFLEELVRVTDDALLITAPFLDPRTDEAERILARFLEERIKVNHRFLSEHREHGLPEMDATVAAIEERLGKVVSVPNGSLDRWLLMMALSFYLDLDESLGPLKSDVSAYYNRHYYRADNCEPAYRHLLVSRRPPASPLEPGPLLAAAPAPMDFSPMAALMEASLGDLLKEAYRSIEFLQAEIESREVHAANLSARILELEGRINQMERLLGKLPVRLLRKLRLLPRG